MKALVYTFLLVYTLGIILFAIFFREPPKVCDVGGGFREIQITSGFFFQIWRAYGITSELQLYCTAIDALVFAALMLFAGWFHYHKAAPKLAWFQDVESRNKLESIYTRIREFL